MWRYESVLESIERRDCDHSVRLTYLDDTRSFVEDWRRLAADLDYESDECLTVGDVRRNLLRIAIESPETEGSMTEPQNPV